MAVRIRHDPEVAIDEVDYCARRADGNYSDELPKYVKINNLIIRTQVRLYGKCDELFINPKTKNAPVDGTMVNMDAATEKEFQRYRIRHDPRRRLAFAGFVIAVIGTVIDGAVALGNTPIAVPVAGWWIDCLRIAAWVLKIGGLFLVFKEGLLKS